MASKVDAARATFLADRDAMSAAELSGDDQRELAKMCAVIVAGYGDRKIEERKVLETAAGASVVLGIKEAYLYRDRQVAIGDMMLTDERGSTRQYGVIGYGEFEDRYLTAMQTSAAMDNRWFTRLEAIVHDLRMERADFADARRDQLVALHEDVRRLKGTLENRIAMLRKAAA